MQGGDPAAKRDGAGGGGGGGGEWVLVTGATGGVGRRVVEGLRRRGRRVKALVRDTEKGRKMLGPDTPDFKLLSGDITQPLTLPRSDIRSISKIISCTAVKVGPKEGDTADRAKYYQGIKFYDPTIVGDTPQTVELNGLMHVANIVRESLPQRRGKLLLGFDDDEVVGPEWGALDDVVMGGVSESALRVVRDYEGEKEGGGDKPTSVAVFGGVVRTENRGGFASVRTKNYEPALDLSAYDGIALRVKGDGMRYKFIIRCDTNWDGVSYCRSFDTQKDVWQTIFLPFEEFKAVFRARSLPLNGPRINTSNIVCMQLMLSKFEWVHVSSAGVTRPGKPGVDPEKEPPAVRMNEALGGILTYKLKGEDVVRESGVPYAIVRPCALTEEPRGMPLVVDQGDTIKGKVSRDDIAELCIALLERPEALDKTFEVKSTVPFSQPWTGDGEGAVDEREWGGLLTGLKEGVTGKWEGEGEH
eukprot:jgi/Chlat1/8628/Chrsp86S00660